MDEDSDTSKESTIEVPETIPLRWSTRQKRSAPHCNLCDLEIRDECGGHAWKHLRTTFACFNWAHIQRQNYRMTTKRYSPDWPDYPARETDGRQK